MASWFSSFTPTGGWSYHYLALKYSRTLWEGHRQHLESRLTNWQSFCRELILVGPSGGYSLPRTFLEDFEHLHIYDPDPLAEWLWRQSPLNVPVTWSREKILFQSYESTLEGLAQLRDRHPEAALLFCNILGQWPLLDPSLTETHMAGLAQKLTTLFPGARWASYHDLFSGKSPYRKWPTQLKTIPLSLTTLSEVEQFWRNVDGQTLFDHLTFEAFPQIPNKYQWAWPLTPRQVHIIEWVQGI